MLIRDIALTPALARWLCESHDDGTPELRVTEQDHYARRGSTHADILVLRADGFGLSDTEHAEITARLAAHAAEALS